VQGAAAAQVMKQVFGRDNIAFTACSSTLAAGSRCSDGNPVLRSFHGFEEAAAENGDSRIFVGYHFRDSVKKGLAVGRQIGQWAVERSFQVRR